MMVTRLSEFEGLWALSRRITDTLGGREGKLEGQAEFIARDEHWLYQETGILHWPNSAPMVANRGYQFFETQGRIEIRFQNGDPFHSFTWANPTATHDCPPDFYEVSYDFGAWPEWTSQWHVTGPRKDYRLLSQYSRP